MRNKQALLLGILLALRAGHAAEPQGPPSPGTQVTEPATAPPLGSAVSEVPELNLLECLEEALLNNPDLGINRAAVEKARAQRLAANGRLWPDLELSYNEVWQQENSVTIAPGSPPVEIAPGNTRQFSLQSTWVLYSGGALQAGQAIARLGQAAAEHQYTAGLNGVISQTVTAYLSLLRAEELKGVADETVRLAAEQVKVATANFEAGTVPRVNVLRAEAALQNALQGQLRAGNGIELARAALNKIMGRGQLRPVRVAKLNINLAGAPELLDSLRLAVLQRPELRAQQKLIEINEESVRAAQAGYLPNLAVNGTVTNNPSSGAFGSENDFRVTFAFRLKLWDGFITRGNVQAARADVERERRVLERSMQEIELQVRQSVLRLSEAAQRVDAAGAEVRAATQAHEIENLRYTTGDGTFLELLDARRALSESRANLVGALYDYALAEADWLMATGGYVAGDTANLPQGQTMPLPTEHRSRGVDYEDLLNRYAPAAAGAAEGER